MQILEKNVRNIWGKKGEDWLLTLPSIINRLSISWLLSDIKPVNNMNYNYVALALQETTTPVVLKISCDEQLIMDEYKALKLFDGHGAIKVLDINAAFNALLLEQAVPGYLLKDHSSFEETIDIYAQVVKALSSRQLSSNDYTHVSKWCDTIDRITDERIEKDFIHMAKKLTSTLLNSAEHEYLCHGDLHLENIIQQQTYWLAIDPKGIIGEMAFEASAFDLISKDEINNVTAVRSKIINRVTKLSSALELDFDRLLSWIFLRAIISAQWFVEDKGNPNDMLSLATHLYPLLKLNDRRRILK